MIQPHLLFISGVEIAFILVFVLLIFGADKIPEIARGLGKGLRQVKDATNDIKSEISKSADKQGCKSRCYQGYWQKCIQKPKANKR